MINYLEKLLDGQTVEWKNLWEVTIWDKKFNAVEKEKQFQVIKYHYFLASELKSLTVENGNVKLLTTNISDLWTTEELAGNKISEGEIVAIPWGGNPVVQYFKGKFVTADNRIATSKDTSLLDNKFLYYFLLSKLDLISSFYRGSGIKHPSMLDVLNLEIPIPPLYVQKEIVKILDKITELEATLEAELTLRNKQYHYYRDLLLDYNNPQNPFSGSLKKVEWKTLGEVFDISAGGDVPKEALSEIKTDEFNVPILSNGINDKSLYGWTSQAKITKPSLTISARGTIGWTSYQTRPFFPIVRLLVLTPTIELNLKYSYYFMKTIENTYKVPESGIPQLTKPMIKDIKIPIPPLEVQNKIVAILDKFDTLTQFISEGLPHEIALRRKQYEYYREQLLNFPKP